MKIPAYIWGMIHELENKLGALGNPIQIDSPYVRLSHLKEMLEVWEKGVLEPAPEVNEWQRAVEEACTVLHLSMSGKPKEDLNRLIDWEVRVALDPQVSKEAAALVQTGRELERAENAF